MKRRSKMPPTLKPQSSFTYKIIPQIQVSAFLLFTTNPQNTNTDSVVDVSIWNSDNSDEMCELKDVSYTKRQLQPDEAEKLIYLCSNGEVCVMCSCGNHVRTIGCTIFSAGSIINSINKKTPLMIKHPLNQSCIAFVQFESMEPLPESINTESRMFQLIERCNRTSARITSEAESEVREMAKSMGYQDAFFPAELCGKAFVNLCTFLPCTVMQQDLVMSNDVSNTLKSKTSRIDMPMPLLEKMVESQTDIIPFPWVAYFIYGACLIENINPSNFDSAAVDDASWTSFFETFVTLITCDPGYNVYKPDTVPIGVKKEVGINNRSIETWEFEVTESIQRPFSKVKMAPDDCEDWAMLLKLMSMGPEYHAKKTDDELLKELDNCHLFTNLSKGSKKGIVNITRKLAELSGSGRLNVRMSCGIAGAPNLNPASYNPERDHPGGHEFCFFYESGEHKTGKQGKYYASILEGTNWTKCTHLDYRITSALNMMCMEKARRIGIKNTENIRIRGMQHVGGARESVLEAFWRNIIALGDCVLVSTTGAEKKVKQYGANVGRLLDYYEDGQKSDSVHAMPIGESMGTKSVRDGYIEDMRVIFNKVNLPKAKCKDFTEIVKDWHPAIEFSKLPEDFTDRTAYQYHNFFTHEAQAKKDEGVGFMGRYLFFTGLATASGAPPSRA